MNYVGEEKLFSWYHSVAKAPRRSNAELLAEIHRQCVETHAEEFVLPPEKTITGREERYAYRCETIGACGANTGFMYF